MNKSTMKIALIALAVYVALEVTGLGAMILSRLGREA